MHLPTIVNHIESQLLYVGELFFIWGITLARVTVLTWYANVFTTRHFRRANDIVLIICLIWCLAMTVAFVLQCVPLKKSWDPQRTTGTQCVLFGLLVLFQEMTNVVLDIVILVLPISVTRNLQLPARQRWILSLIFLLGGLYVALVPRTHYPWCCVVSS